MKTDYESTVIIEDDDKKGKKNKLAKVELKKWYFENKEIYEIGVDEAGRGPLFGRVYTAAVILPKDDVFQHFLMKDSKKFYSKKKMEDVANYIKENAIAWYVSFEDEGCIDEINILQATQKSMHDSIRNTISQLINSNKNNSNKKEFTFQLLIDGNYFNPFKMKSTCNSKCEFVPHICIEGGDNKYTAIAAASILAKVFRDNYIEELVKENPELIDKYGIDSNKGYGAKKHIDGIKEYGITPWHRKTFGICKSFV
jgi:ribonuclease HII